MSDDTQIIEPAVGETEITPAEPEAAVIENADPADAPIEEPAEPGTGKKKHWSEIRLSETTAQRNEERAKREKAEKELDDLRAKQAAGATGIPEEEIEKIIKSRLAKELPVIEAQREFAKKTTDILEYGKQSFNGFTDSLRKMGEIVGEQWNAYSGTLAEAVSKEEAAKIINHLANDPDEALKIASLPYPRQIAEFTKMGIKLTEPKPSKPISDLPKPITAVGTSHANPAPKSVEKATSAAEHHKIRMAERKAAGKYTW